MPLIPARPMLEAARAGHYAVPMFDVSNYEMIRGIVEAAESVRSPVMLAGLKPDLEGRGLDYFLAMARVAAEGASVPVAIHLDHAGSFAECRRVIDAGFTSVMIDWSTKSFAENVEATRQVCEYAHARGITVEAELGHVPDAIAGHGESAQLGHGQVDSQPDLTRPDEVARFVELTGVDALAISIGTAHGAYVSAPVLDIERLRQINAISKACLVLHGGSGTPEDQLRNAVANGITKINVFTDLLVSMFSELKSGLNASANIGTWPHLVYRRPIQAMQATAIEKMRIFGSINRA